MRSFRRVTQRVAPAFASVASVLLFATCDFDKISGTPKPITANDLAKVFSITPVDSVVTLGGTLTLAMTPATGIDLSSTTKRWSSNNAAFARVDTLTGVVTGVGVGTSTITARLLSPELDTGYARSRNVRVRYKAIKVAAIDSIPGKNLAKAITVQGTNNTDQLQSPPISAPTLSAHDSGSTNSNVATITGSNVVGRANGVAYVVALFDSFRDSVKVKVRQVAKTLAFPAGDYTAQHLNLNRPALALNMTDVNDSVMTSSPLMRWRSSDTTVVTIDSLTGIFRVKKKDTARIYARVDTINVGLNNIAKSRKIVVAQMVGSMTKFAGDGQTDTVATQANVLPTVTALDSGSTPVAGDTIVFRRGIGFNATITDSVKITDVDGRATLGGWKLGDVAGASSNTVIATARSGITATFTTTTIAGPPKKLAFVVHPTSVGQGNAITPVMTVQVQDSVGNLIANATNSITLSIGNDPSGGVASLGGTLTVAAVNGVATFTGIGVTMTGTGFTLVASASGLTDATSVPFDVFGSKTKLGFTTQPVNGTATLTMQPVRVAIQDADGRTVTNATDSVSLAFTSNPQAVNLTGTTKVAAVAGVATFSNLTVSGSASAYTFTATAPSLTNAQSSSFTINPVGQAARLEFQQQPTNATAGAAISPNIAVRVLDANGALVTSSSHTITLSIESSSPSGASLSGNTQLNSTAGVATFSGIGIAKAGTAYKLLASSTSPAIATVTSSAFNVSAGTATKLGFFQQPTHTVQGSSINPGVVVEVQDASGNRVPSGSGSWSIGLALGTCSTATLSGGAAQITSTGAVTFASLILSAQTTNCVLTASATGLTSAPSQSFNSIAATGAAKLNFIIEPATTASAGSGTSGGTVRFEDNNGNAVTTTSTQITLTPILGPGQIISGTTQQNATTSASFSNLQFNLAGTYRLVATAPGFRPDTSVQITVGAGTASKLAFINQPTNTFLNAPLGYTGPAVRVAVQDQFGNTVTTNNSANIRISVNIGPSSQFRCNGANAQGFCDHTASQGIITLSNLTNMTTAGNSYQLIANSTNIGLTQGGSVIFNVGATDAKTKLVWNNQPSASTSTYGVKLRTAAGTTPNVFVTDQWNNLVTDATDLVSVGIGTDANPTTVLAGTVSVAAAGGGASFPDLTLNKAGTGFTLLATAAGLTSGISSSFNVTLPGVLTPASIWDMVRVGNTIYYTENSQLVSIPTTGVASTTITGSNQANRIVSDGTNIYWIERGTNNNGDAFIKKLSPPSTVTTMTVALASTDWFSGSLATDGTNVFFIAKNAAGNGVTIRSVSVNASNATPTDMFATTDLNSPYFTLSGGNLYYYDPALAAIRRLSSGGGSPTTIATGVTAGQLQLVGTTLYFIQFDGKFRSIANAPTAGIVTPDEHFDLGASATVYDFVIDNNQLYIKVDAAIRRYSTSNFGSFTTLASAAEQWFSSILLDGFDMYFSDQTTSLRLAKIPR